MKYFILMAAVLLMFTGCSLEKDENILENPLPDLGISQVESAVTEATVPVRETALLSQLIDPRNEDLVRVKDYIPEVIVDLKYATEDNFTGQVIYDFEDVFLRYGTVMKLCAVHEELAKQGLGLKIWDGFRPVSAQFKLWEVCPDDTYVANPNRGFSNHSRGFAVDITLVDSEGNELEMPTEFDDFSGNANRSYYGCSPQEATNAKLLQAIMEKHGFAGYWGEWWHFNDTDSYDVEEYFDPGVICRMVTLRETSMLTRIWESASGILDIPAGEPVTLLGYREEYSLVEYWGYRGYVLSADLNPLN